MMVTLSSADFNVVNHQDHNAYVRISEINRMIEYGAITIDKQKLREYKFDTTVMYNKDVLTREEAMRMWFENH